MPHKKKMDVKVLPTFTGGVSVKYKDVFDVRVFYEDFHEYLIEQDWVDEEDKLDHFETYYGERSDRNNVKEIWVQWRLFKKVPDASYLKFYLDVDMHVLGLADTEIVREGMKLRVNKGEIEVTLKPSIHKTYDEQFEKLPLFKELKNLFNRRIYLETLEQRKKELYQETYMIQNWLKQWFQLRRHLPYQDVKSFFPSQAWPSHMKN